MAKFKAGDVVVHSSGYVSEHKRIVIGYSQDGRVVYECHKPFNGWSVQVSDEENFKLAPVKKEGWIIVGKELGIPGARHASYIYPTKELAEEKYGTGIFVKVEWEE